MLPELHPGRTAHDGAGQCKQKTDFVYEAEILNTAGEEMEVQFGADRITWKDGFLSWRWRKRSESSAAPGAAGKLENLRIFCDTSSIELFANDGEAVFTSGSTPMPQHHN
ncbi:MAG: GH32 C-terminal domain-containing protein [Ruminococcus callidus]